MDSSHFKTFLVDAIIENLRHADTEPVSTLTFRPKGGELYKFKAEGVKAQDWRADGHRWVNQGTVALPRKNSPEKKKYFYIATENGASKGFVKFVYHEPGQENGPFLIQYIGNEEISQAHAHGNAKNQARPFVRTKPGQDSREKSLEAIDQLQEAWLGDFKKYFNDRISPNLTKVCKWAIDKITRFDPYSGFTQNQSESMNKLLKSLNKWNEAPVDVVVLSFLRLHQYYIKEISRGHAGLSNYNLRPQYISAKIDLSDIVQFAVCQPQYIVNAIRENQLIASPVQEESKNVDDHPKVDIHMFRADELIKNDRIVLSPTLGTFTAKGTDDQSRVVTIFPEKCSCSLKSCYHILEVKKLLV